MQYERQHLAILKSRMAEPRRRMQIIMGPRQVGKSTLVYQFCDGLDTPYDFFSADGVGRFDTTWIPNRWQEARMKMDLHGDKEHIIIIDEVQKIIGWSEQVKKEWDEDTRNKRNLKVILLGSSRVLLQKGLDESLEGRFEPIKMGFWEWNEMRDAFGFTMQQYIYFGGFPGLAPDIHDEDRWRNLMEDSIITPILTRDILEIEEIRNPALLRQVFELACMESARELSLTKMQGTMNSGTVPTIKNYLNILDQTMTVKPLQKYAPSVIKEKNSVPKMQVFILKSNLNSNPNEENIPLFSAVVERGAGFRTDSARAQSAAPGQRLCPADDERAGGPVGRPPCGVQRLHQQHDLRGHGQQFERHGRQ